MAPSHLRRVLVPAAAAAALFWTPAAGAWTGSGSGSTTTASSFSGEACLAKSAITPPITARRFVRRLAQTITASAGCASIQPTGGAEHSSVGATASVGPYVTVSSDAFDATVVGQGNASDAQATVMTADVTIVDPVSLLPTVTVHAELLFAHAHAECTSSGAVVSGDSQVGDVTVNTIDVGGGTAPNTEITVPGTAVSVILNAQEPSGSGNSGAIDVTAVKIILPFGEVDLVTAHADIQCVSGTPSPCPSATDFTTSGGWFDDHGDTSHRDYFANSAGYKSGSIWGHLVYRDKATGMKAEGDPVWYGPNGVAQPTLYDRLGMSVTGPQLGAELFGPTNASNARYVIGTLKGGGAYFVRTVDAGEPGRHVDQFDIAFLHVDTDALGMPTGSYSYQGGYAAQSDPYGIAGGNVQLHQNCGCGGT